MTPEGDKVDPPVARGLGDWAQRDPRRPALLLGDGTEMTYGHLFERAAALATYLEQAGAGRDAPVALRLPNGVGFIETTCACNLLGVVHVPLNDHASLAEVQQILDDAGARVLIAEQGWLAERYAALADAAPSMAKPPLATIAIERLAHCRSVSADDRTRLTGPPRGVDGFRMTYTSGTTGEPKAILRDADGGIEWMQRLWTALGLHSDERHLSPGPYYHAGPNTFVMGQLLFGGAIAVAPRFDAAETLVGIERDRLTSVQLVPTMLQRIRALQAERCDTHDTHDTSSLRVLFHAAAPCPPELKRWALGYFGADRVREYYASSEVGATLITGDEWLARPGSVGRPIPGCFAQVVDADWRELPPGEIGRVCLRAEGRSTFHYRGGSGRTAAERLGPGWCATDDLGYVDDAGFLFLVGRDADLVISGGVNVYTRKVELTLLEHPAIADAAAIGLPDDDLGERVAVAVQLGHDAPGGITAEEIERFARRRLTPAELPRLITFVTDLPRSEAGKVVKGELRQVFATGNRGHTSTGTCNSTGRST